VKDFLQRVDVWIDEQASIDFDRWISTEVKRLGRELLGARKLVRDVVLRQKAFDQACLLFSTSGEKPYSHPPPPLPPRFLWTSFWTDAQTVILFSHSVK
jgi:hypothetical protein